MQFAGPERVAPCSFLGEDAAQGEGVVRLDRGQDQHRAGGPVPRECVANGARVAAHLALRHHVQRGAEALRELSDAAFLHPQRAGAHRQGAVEGAVRGIVGHGGTGQLRKYL